MPVDDNTRQYKNTQRHKAAKSEVSNIKKDFDTASREFENEIQQKLKLNTTELRDLEHQLLENQEICP